MTIETRTQSITPHAEKRTRANGYILPISAAKKPKESRVNGNFDLQIEPSAEKLRTAEKIFTGLNDSDMKMLGEAGPIKGLSVYIAELRNIPFQREKHQQWGEEIFAGKIALLALSQLSQSDLLSPSQKEKIMQILQENKFLLPIAESTVKNTRLRLKDNIYKDKKLKKLDETFIGLVKTSEEVVRQKINRAKVSEDVTERAQLMQKFIDNQINCANQGKLAFNNLVAGNLRLSISFAYRYQERLGLPIENLVSYAGDGVMGAAARWDPRRGIQFSTYAVWWIRQALSRGTTDEGPLIRLPVSVSDQVRRYRKEQAQFFNRPQDNKPLPDTLASGLATQRVISLNQPLTVDGGTEFGDVVPDPAAENMEDIVSRRERKEMVDKELLNLTEKEKRVLELRFGLNDGREKSLAEVGRVFGVCRERIRQIERIALRKLKQSKRLKEVSETFDA